MVDSAHLKPWILVVDDNGDAADLLALALRLFHYEVRVAYNGFDAVAAALEDRPDVVVLDIGMPFLSGFEVARQIRGALGSNVLLIAHTAWNDSATLGRCKEAGFDHHLTKPADLSDILALADPGGSAGLGPQTRCLKAQFIHTPLLACRRVRSGAFTATNTTTYILGSRLLHDLRTTEDALLGSTHIMCRLHFTTLEENR